MSIIRPNDYKSAVECNLWWDERIVHQRPISKAINTLLGKDTRAIDCGMILAGG